MGVWIRSQNKCRLVECTRFGVSSWFDGICNVLGYNCNGDCILGEYESEEKAIKVLDMIQDHIANSDNIFRNVANEQDWVGEIITHSNNVFQMPQDIIAIDDEEEEV
jgi:hypothetical protein